jgi:hypothetical protein
MAYGCLGIRLTLVMCLMLDIKLTLYQNFIYMVSYNRENSFQSYIIQHLLLNTSAKLWENLRMPAKIVHVGS